MKAMIFAAGLGTRLRPLTDHTPKALVPIAGKTMLERVILRLKDAGFNDITINIHHFGEQIIEFLRTHNDSIVSYLCLMHNTFPFSSFSCPHEQRPPQSPKGLR